MQGGAVGGRWSSRKFWAAMFWQSVVTLLVWFNKIPDTIFETLTFLILGGYFLSNVAQKAITNKPR